MSRFENLEFGGAGKQRPQHAEKLKDEVYYVDEATAAFQEGDYEMALRAYAKALEHNPGNAAAWTGQVKMLIELGEFNEAKLWADKALELFPTEPELLAAKAVALGRSGDHRGALVFSDASVEERGDTAYIWLARADVLLGRSEKTAEYSFQKAFEIAGPDWLSHWLASRIQYFHHQFASALKNAQRALDLDPGKSVVWLQTGLCQLALGMATHAANSFEQARQLNPSCQQAHQALHQLSNVSFADRLRHAWRQLFLR